MLYLFLSALTLSKIDVVLDAKRAAALPPPKGLGERITQPKTQPKAQPKSAAVTKATASTRGKSARGRGRGGSAKSARPAKKTAEELDSEMVDYFGGSTTETNGAGAGNAQPATNGDANMDDEVLVSLFYFPISNSR
jgi:THO complex subunit 4